MQGQRQPPKRSRAGLSKMIGKITDAAKQNEANAALYHSKAAMKAGDTPAA